MKVALLSFDFGEYCIRLASALSCDAEVMLLLPDKRAAPHLSKLASGVKFQPFKKPRLRQPVEQSRMVREILKRVGSYEPDVIHLQQGHLWFNLALPLLARYPLVLTIHDLHNHLGDAEAYEPQMLWNFGFRRADHLITHSRRISQQVAAELKVTAERLHVIPHIALGDPPTEIGLTQQGRLVLFFGRLWPYKGLEFLIRAEPLVTKRFPDARIVIAGEGEDFARYQKLMVHPDKFIVLNRYISHEKRAELFLQSSIVVLPYIEASQSGVIPLAYTYSKPVVATTVGGLPEMVRDGETGYLVPPRDEKALADAIVRLLENDEARRQMGANARRRLETECSPSVIADKTLDVYRLAVVNTTPASGNN